MKKRIGDFLLEKGVINEDQIEEVLKHSKRTGLKFGEAAMELGFVKRKDLINIFGPNFSVDFFHLEPRYFPPQTLDILPKETVLRYGVLPLGIKTEYRFFRAKKFLNIGFLDPSSTEAFEAVKKATGPKFSDGSFAGIKKYLVLADQFIDVLQHVFGFSEPDLRGLASGELNETVQMFLQGASDLDSGPK